MILPFKLPLAEVARRMEDKPCREADAGIAPDNGVHRAAATMGGWNCRSSLAAEDLHRSCRC